MQDLIAISGVFFWNFWGRLINQLAIWTRFVSGLCESNGNQAVPVG